MSFFIEYCNSDKCNQGKYAVQSETGFNFFEYRTWDSRLARWTAPDPYQQYFSPYIGMGNNPINSVDPDGGQNIEIASTERNSADVLNSVPSSPSQGGGANYPEYPMNTSYAGVQDNNQTAPPSASAPEDELLNNSPNRDINSLSNPMSIPDIAPIASDQTDNQPPSWDNIDAFFTNPRTPINPTYEERCEANDAEWAAYIESERRYPQPSEPFYMVWANRKWLSEQCSKPRYNWEGMKARQNAEAARVNAEMGRNSKNINYPFGPYTSWIGLMEEIISFSRNPAYNQTKYFSPSIADEAQANKILKSTSKVFKNIGWAGEIAGMGFAGYNAWNSPTAGNVGRFNVSLTAAALNFIPLAGTTLSFATSVADASGCFNSYYNTLDNVQQKTGIGIYQIYPITYCTYKKP